MPYRWTSIVLLTLVFALPGHPQDARPVVSDLRRADPPPARLDASGDPLPPGALWRLGSLRLNAGGPVEFLAFTPDGKSLISAGQMGVSQEGVRLQGSVIQEGSALQVWDAATGRRRDLPALANLPTTSSRPGSVEGDAAELPVVGGLDSIVQFASSGQSHSLKGRLLFTHDGQTTGHLIDTRSMRVLRSWWMMAGQARSHAMTPDAALFAWPSAKPGVVNVIEPMGKGSPRELPLGTEGNFGPMAISADGKYLAVVEPRENTVLLVLVKGGKRLRRYKAKNAPFVGFGDDGRSLLIGTNEGIEVYETDSLDQKFKLEQAGAQMVGVTWVVPGKRLATRHHNDAVIFWDVATGKRLREVTVETWQSSAFAVSPDGLRVATASDAGQIRLWDARTGKPTLPPAGAKPILAAGFDASGGEIVVVQAGQVQRYRARDGKPGRKVEVELAADTRVVLSPKGDRIAELGAAPGVIDTKTGKKRLVFDAERTPGVHQFVFLPDGRYALMDLQQPDAIVLDLETNRRWKHFRIGEASTAQMVVSEDGRTLYRTPTQTAVERWEVATGKQRPPLDIAGQLVDVSQDGRRIAVGVGDVVQVVDLDSGRTTLLPHAIDASWSVYFTPDGEWIICAGKPERGMTVWDHRTGRLAARVHGHRGTLRGWGFSPNGKEFLTVSTDGTLVVWDLAEVLRLGRVAPAVVPPVRPMEAVWADLASDDAALADRAVREAVRCGGVAERFLARHLRPVAPIPPQLLDGLLADLDGDRITLRDSAEDRLAALGEQAVPAVRAAEKAGSPEVRRRAKRLLERIDVFARTGLQARPSRAIEALEAIGTPAARRLLGELALGADAFETREARAAQARLRGRVSSEP